MFDHASSAAGATASGTEDRVVAVWGLSRCEPASTRDKQRMAGFLRGVWSQTYPGYDRGHFFARTDSAEASWSDYVTFDPGQ
jgi:hypothetical protein